MNRRNLLKLSGQAAIGLVAAPFASKALRRRPTDTPKAIFGPSSATVITLNLSDKRIVDAIERDYRSNGRIRNLIQEDGNL